MYPSSTLRWLVVPSRKFHCCEYNRSLKDKNMNKQQSEIDHDSLEPPSFISSSAVSSVQNLTLQQLIYCHDESDKTHTAKIPYHRYDILISNESYKLVYDNFEKI